MAYLVQDDKQQQQNGQPQNGGQMSSAPLSGGQSGPSTVTSSSPSTAGIGAGGNGGWTNIQAYLNANQGATGTANILNNKVGSAFDQEKQNSDTQAAQAKSKAQSAVDANNVSQDQASKMIEQAGSQYNYKQPQSDQYNQTISGLSNKLSAQYQGPQNYTYGMGAQAQQYGTDLGNDQGFSGMMNKFYQDAAGGTMGSGALALQGQLDQNNENVLSARANLLNKYAGLQSDENKSLKDTNEAINQAKNQFTTNQSNLRDYLSNNLAKQNKDELDAMVSKDQAAQDALLSSHDYTQRADTNDQNYGWKQVLLSRWLGGNDSARSVDNADLDYYQKFVGDKASEQNVAEGDAQRNRYNAIMDVLGKPADKIQRSDKDWTKGGYALDMDALTKHYNQIHPTWDFDGLFNG